MCYQLLGKERGNILFPSGPWCSSAQGRNDVRRVCKQPEHVCAGRGGLRAAPGPAAQKHLSLGSPEPQRGEGSTRPGPGDGKARRSVEASGSPPHEAWWVGMRSGDGAGGLRAGMARMAASLKSPRFPWRNLTHIPLVRHLCLCVCVCVYLKGGA